MANEIRDDLAGPSNLSHPTSIPAPVNPAVAMPGVLTRGSDRGDQARWKALRVSTGCSWDAQWFLEGASLLKDGSVAEEDAHTNSRMGTAQRLGFLRAADRPGTRQQRNRPIVGNRKDGLQPRP